MYTLFYYTNQDKKYINNGLFIVFIPSCYSCYVSCYILQFSVTV